MAHEIPYVATATVADLRDLEAKVEKAMSLRGARYLHILVPCPLGWGAASCDTIKLARLARETGIFPVFEAEHGEVTRGHQDPPPRAGGGLPASRRSASRTCSARTGHPEILARIQAMADRNIRRFGLLDETERMTMDKPFAITLDPGSSLANKTGSWRTERPVYVDRLPPCNAQCPAGEDIQGWLFHAESGDYEAAWRHLTRDNPFPAIMGRVCYHTCEGACNRGQARRGGRHQLGRAFPRRRGAEAGLDICDAARPRPASMCWWSAPGLRACRRPTTCAAWAIASR